MSETKQKNNKEKVAVCSRSFSKNNILRNELLSSYKNVSFNETGNQLKGKDLLKFLKGHDKAIVALEIIDDYLLSQLPELKVISKYGVGLDMIDTKAMHKYGKRLGWTGGVNRRSVSELVIAFSIVMLRQIIPSNVAVNSGNWQQYLGGELSGKTFGIVGCGHVGKDLVKLLQPFKCNIMAYDIINYENFYKQHGVKPATLNHLLKNSDIVSLHVPLDASSLGIIDRKKLSLMKENGILINAARGGLVDEIALKEALKTGEIAAAAFDVFATEPPTDIELLNLSNFLATPHIGGSSREAVLAMGRAAIKTLDDNKMPL